MDLTQELRSNAAAHLVDHHQRIILDAVAKRIGTEVHLEALRERLAVTRVGDIELWELDGKPLIQFFPLRTIEEYRNGSHFFNLSLPYRVFEWELPA